MNRASALLTSILVIALLAASASAQVAGRSITVNGEALIWVVPDEVEINLGIETFDPTLDGAKTQNDRAAERMLIAIKAVNVDPKQIQTANLEFEIHYNNEQHPSRGIEGYYARRLFSVTLKDIKQFEPLVDAALKSGANHIIGFEYRTTELRKYRDQARAMAIRAAKEKAALLCKEVDCEVGKPSSISEGYFGYMGNWGSRGSWNNSMNYNAMAQNNAQAGGGEDSGQTLPLGQVGVRAQVNVNFDLK